MYVVFMECLPCLLQIKYNLVKQLGFNYVLKLFPSKYCNNNHTFKERTFKEQKDHFHHFTVRILHHYTLQYYLEYPIVLTQTITLAPLEIGCFWHGCG